MLEHVEAQAQEAAAVIKGRDWEGMKVMARSWGEMLGMMFLRRKRLFGCGVGRGLLAVSTRGDVFACHRFVGLDDYQLGTIFDGDVDRGRYLLSPVRDDRPCSDCWAKYWCGGGCAYDHLALTGSLDGRTEKAARCELIKFGVERAIHLWWGELEPPDRDYVRYTGILQRGKKDWPFEPWKQ